MKSNLASKISVVRGDTLFDTRCQFLDTIASFTALKIGITSSLRDPVSFKLLVWGRNSEFGRFRSTQ